MRACLASSVSHISTCYGGVSRHTRRNSVTHGRRRGGGLTRGGITGNQSSAEHSLLGGIFAFRDICDVICVLLPSRANSTRCSFNGDFSGDLLNTHPVVNPMCPLSHSNLDKRQAPFLLFTKRGEGKLLTIDAFLSVKLRLNLL